MVFLCVVRKKRGLQCPVQTFQSPVESTQSPVEPFPLQSFHSPAQPFQSVKPPTSEVTGDRDRDSGMWTGLSSDDMAEWRKYIPGR